MAEVVSLVARHKPPYSLRFSIATYCEALVMVALQGVSTVRTAACAIIAALLVILLVLKKIDEFPYLLLALMMANSYCQLACIAALVIWRGRRISKLSILLILFSLFGLFGGQLVSSFIFETPAEAINIASGLIQLVVVFLYLKLVPQLREMNVDGECLNMIRIVFICECVCVAVQFALSGQTGDVLRGTWTSAHFAGMFIMAYGYLQLKLSRVSLRSISVFLFAFLISYVVLDAKHVVACFIAAIAIEALLKWVGVRWSIFVVGSALLLLGFIVVPVLENGAVKEMVSDASKEARTYLYNDDWNKKYQMIRTTFEDTDLYLAMFGYGIGQYGSQSQMSVEKRWLTATGKTLDTPYQRRVDSIVDQGYYKRLPVGSMVLSYPFFSLIALIAELGLVGFLLFCAAFDYELGECDKTFFISFLFIAIFDIYFEHPEVFAMMLVFSTMSTINGKGIDRKADSCSYRRHRTIYVPE